MALHHVFARKPYGAIKKKNIPDSNLPPMNLSLSISLSSSLEPQSPTCKMGDGIGFPPHRLVPRIKGEKTCPDRSCLG